MAPQSSNGAVLGAVGSAPALGSHGSAAADRLGLEPCGARSGVLLTDRVCILFHAYQPTQLHAHRSPEHRFVAFNSNCSNVFDLCTSAAFPLPWLESRVAAPRRTGSAAPFLAPALRSVSSLVKC